MGKESVVAAIFVAMLLVAGGAVWLVSEMSKTAPVRDIFGCTDPSAENYDSGATADDGSCEYQTPPPIEGCMDPIALNYNSEATVDDGSCEYETPPPVEGCTNSSATNYNPNATVDDGSCEFPPDDVLGCMDSNATNYNPNATVDDGSCEFPPDDVLGCMDSNATNYNPNATVDDGSCEYDSGTPPGEPADEELTVDASAVIGEIAHVNGLMKGPTFETGWNDISCNQQNYQQDVDFRDQFDQLMIPNTRMQGETIGDIDKIWKPWPEYEGHDVTDPANYNFTLTDFGVERTFSTEYTTVLFKAGHSKWLEEWNRPTCDIGPYYAPPDNFTVFAQVIKQVLMHYREGWADGYNYTKMNMVEVWNEPWGSHWWNGTALQYFELWGEVDRVVNEHFGDEVLVAANIALGSVYGENLFLYADAVGQTIDAFNLHQYYWRPSQILYDVGGHDGALVQLFQKYNYPIDTPILVTEWNRKIPYYTQSSASQPFIMGALTMYNDLWHQNGNYGLRMTHFFATGFLFYDDGTLEREGMTFAAYGDMLNNTPVRVATTGSHYEHDGGNHSTGGRTQDINILAGRSPIGDAVTAAISIYDITDTVIEDTIAAPDYFSNSSRTVNFTISNLSWGADCSFSWERWTMKNAGLTMNSSGISEGTEFHVSKFVSNDRGLHIFRLYMDRDDPNCQLAVDDDHDGVDDSIDQCLNTPRLAEIDMVGCAYDDDGDGVANIIDDCEMTLPGLSVDVNGCVPRTSSSPPAAPLTLPSEVPQHFSDWLGAPVNGTTYHFAVDEACANDSLDGLSATCDGQGGGPWKTFFGLAGKSLAPGDQLLFHGGVYDLPMENNTVASNGIGHGLSFNHNGTADEPIRVQAAGDGEVWWDANINPEDYSSVGDYMADWLDVDAFLIRGNYNIFQEINLRGCGNPTCIQWSGHHLIWTNSTISGGAEDGIKTTSLAEDGLMWNLTFRDFSDNAVDAYGIDGLWIVHSEFTANDPRWNSNQDNGTPFWTKGDAHNISLIENYFHDMTVKHYAMMLGGCCWNNWKGGTHDDEGNLKPVVTHVYALRNTMERIQHGSAADDKWYGSMGVEGAHDVHIEGNIFLDVDAVFGMKATISNGSRVDSDNVTFINNIVVGGATSSLHRIAHSPTNVTIDYNTYYVDGNLISSRNTTGYTSLSNWVANWAGTTNWDANSVQLAETDYSG